MRIAFDVDGTLIYAEGMGQEPDSPRYDVIYLLMMLHAFDHEIFVWSGGGLDYAARWVQKLGLGNFVEVIEKGQLFNGEIVDIAVDDEDVELGKVNLKV